MKLVSDYSNIDQLVKDCIKNKINAQYELYNRFSPKMFGVCLRYAPDRAQAEDILQEGFIKVFKNLKKFRFEGSFEGWVRRIMVNTAIEHYRKNVQMYPLIEEVNHDSNILQEGVHDKLAKAELLEMVQRLSPGYKTIFNLYVIEGYTHKDIATELGISEGTSKSQLARARVLLQKMIKEIQAVDIEAYAGF